MSQKSALLALLCSLGLAAPPSVTQAAPRREPVALPAPEAQVDTAKRNLSQPSDVGEHMRAELGLGTRDIAAKLLRARPSPALRQAARGSGARRLLWPVEGGHFVRGFGFVRKMRKDLPHLGVDIAAAPGTPIHAAADGIVAYANDEVRGYGNLAMLVHADGAVTSYAHCRKLYVMPGQHVQRGEVIGEVGSTGISQGPHLHFEYRSAGRPRNPMTRFDRPARDASRGVPVAALERVEVVR